MNRRADRDATAQVRVVRSPGSQERGDLRSAVTQYAAERDAARPEASPPPSDAAARARRYRARKRGENVPLRKPGPRAEDWRRRAAEAEAELRKARAELADAQALPVAARIQQGTIAGHARVLLGKLNATDPARDMPGVREALRDLFAAIDERHDYWPES